MARPTCRARRSPTRRLRGWWMNSKSRRPPSTRAPRSCAAPRSTHPAARGLYSRQPVPNNIIPAHRISPVSAKIAALWDTPNQPGTVDGTNNYTKGKNAQDTYWNHIVRIDHNFSEKQRLYVRTNFTSLQRPENIRHNRAVGDN